MEKPILAITMGDPASIGPEITVKALARPEIYQICRPLVVGDACMLERARYVTGLEDVRVLAVDTPSAAEYAPGMIDVLDMRLVDAGSLPIGRVSAKAGEAAFRYVEKAIAMAMADEVDGTVTNAFNKEAINLAGHHFPDIPRYTPLTRTRRSTR